MSETKKKTGFALLTPEERSALGKRGYQKAKAAGRTGHRWTAQEAKERGPDGARACREQGKRHVMTPEEMARSSSRFTSETGRKAIEKRHDEEAKADPEVVWLDETPE